MEIKQKNMESKSDNETNIPSASEFVSSPLRNRIRIEINASVLEVWDLIGNLSRFPEYSSGLERVETKKDSSGMYKEYVCHFKPQEEGGKSISHHEIIRWYEPNHGYASSGKEVDIFGLTNDLHMVTIESSKDSTIMTVVEHYDAQDLNMSKASYDEAFGDIAENLISRFGGQVIERYVEK